MFEMKGRYLYETKEQICNTKFPVIPIYFYDGEE